MYSPLLLLQILCAMFKWGHTMKIFNYLFMKPLDLISSENVKMLKERQEIMEGKNKSNIDNKIYLA